MPEDNNELDGDTDTKEGGFDTKKIEERLKGHETKIDDVLRSNQQLAQMLKQATDDLQSSIKPKKSTEDEDLSLSDLMYDNPEKYTKIIEDRTEQRVIAKLAAARQADEEKQVAINKMYQEFPELSDPSAELTKRAVAIYNELPDDQKASAASYKYAILDAARELGVMPKDRRKQEDGDEFTLSNSHTHKSKKREEMPGFEKTIEAAKLFGLDTDDKEVVERLKQYSKRKNWSRYGG